MSEKLIRSDKLILCCWLVFFTGVIFLCIGDTQGDTATTIGLNCVLIAIVGSLIVMAFRRVNNEASDPSDKQAATVEVKKHGLAERKFQDRKQAASDEASKRRLAEQEKKDKAAREVKKINERWAREKEDSLEHLELSTYDLARIVQSVVEEKDFEEDKKVLSVYKKNKMLLNDGLNDLCGSFYDDFEHSIKLFMDSVGCKINYSFDDVKEKLDSLVHRCIDCSKDLVAEKLGLEINNSNSPDSTPIRKTRKWE
jgi:hypothetical protein